MLKNNKLCDDQNVLGELACILILWIKICESLTNQWQANYHDDSVRRCSLLIKENRLMDYDIITDNITSMKYVKIHYSSGSFKL